MAKHGHLQPGRPTRKTFHKLAIQSDGTISRLAVRIARALAVYGVDDEVLGLILSNYNQETARIVKSLPPVYRGRYFMPARLVPGYPDGFLDRPEECAKARPYWEPDVLSHWAEVHRLSSSNDMSNGMVASLKSPAGGHMEMARLHEEERREHFPSSLHTNVFLLPSTDRALWKNLRAYPRYPDELETPTLVLDNKHRQRIDETLPLLFAILVFGQRYTDRGQHCLAECFQHVIDISPTMGLAAAEARLPVIPRKWYDIFLDRESGVNAKEAPQRVADAIVRVLQKDALLIDAEPDPEDPSVVALGGMPVPMRHDGYLEEQHEFKAHVKLLVEQKLKKFGQEYPPGLSIVWASTVQQTTNNFVSIPAIRLFPIRGRTPRSFIDEMLA